MRAPPHRPSIPVSGCLLGEAGSGCPVVGCPVVGWLRARAVEGWTREPVPRSRKAFGLNSTSKSCPACQEARHGGGGGHAVSCCAGAEERGGDGRCFKLRLGLACCEHSCELGHTLTSSGMVISIGYLPEAVAGSRITRPGAWSGRSIPLQHRKERHCLREDRQWKRKRKAVPYLPAFPPLRYFGHRTCSAFRHLFELQGDCRCRSPHHRAGCGIVWRAVASRVVAVLAAPAVGTPPRRRRPAGRLCASASKPAAAAAPQGKALPERRQAVETQAKGSALPASAQPGGEPSAPSSAPPRSPGPPPLSPRPASAAAWRRSRGRAAASAAALACPGRP